LREVIEVRSWARIGHLMDDEFAYMGGGRKNYASLKFFLLFGVGYSL